MMKGESVVEEKSLFEALKQNGIVSFDVGLTETEVRSVKEVSIEHWLSDFNHYGVIDKTLEHKLEAHFGRLEGNIEETIKTIARFVTRITEKMRADFKQDAVWLTVRTSLPNTEFHIPRWHQDGDFLSDQNGNPLSEEYKLVFTLKGAQTRFAEIINTERFEHYQTEEDANNTDLQNSTIDPVLYQEKELALRKNLMNTVQETFPAQDGQATIYRVGGNQGKVHSEPEINESRIFMSVIVGSAVQITELRTRFET